ncbi:MAG: nucleoside hydrolase [Pseudomonadales bacterium]|nr:nucleoside hydrolase [Pseudomonadales bacterium]
MTTKVVFNHDAAIDEYVAGVLLTTMPNVELDNIILTNGDCVAGPAMDAAYRIQQLIGKPDIPLSLSHCRSWNQFPWEYRKDSVILNEIDCLQGIDSNPAWPKYPGNSAPALDYEALGNANLPTDGLTPAYPDGTQALKNTLERAILNQEKVTLLICCPLTLVKNVLSDNPELQAAIEHMICMGGALEGAHGNLDPNTLPAAVANPYAEWNIFWDPYAVAWIFRNTDFPMTLFPLNVTNQASITPEFLDALNEQSHTSVLSTLALQSYQLVLDQPFYKMWDVTTAAYLDRPELFMPPKRQELAIITDGYYQGTLIPQSGGRAVDVIYEIEKIEKFYSYVLGQLATS